MTQGYVEGKRHSTNGLNLYAGIFSRELYSSHRSNGSADQYPKWSKEAIIDKHTSDGKSLPAQAKTRKASGQADNRYEVVEATNLEKGSQFLAGPDNEVQKNRKQNHELVVRACKTNGASFTGNGYDGTKVSGDFARSRESPPRVDWSSRETMEGKNDNGGAVDVRLAKPLKNERMNGNPRPAMPYSIHEGVVANGNPSARVQKSVELDVSSSDGWNKVLKSVDLDDISPNGVTRALKLSEHDFGWPHSGTRYQKSGRQGIGLPDGGYVPKGTTDGENVRTLKVIPDVGNHTVGHSYGNSSIGGSLNGSTPTSEVVLGVERSSSVDNTTGNGSSPPSISTRAIGNATGNVGNSTISGNNVNTNENLPANSAVLRAGSGYTRKPGENMSNSIFTGRNSVDGNLGGGMSTGMNFGVVAQGAIRSSTPTRNGANPGTPILGNLCRGISTGRYSVDGYLGGVMPTGMNLKGAIRSSTPTNNGAIPGTPIVGNLYRGNWNGNLLNSGNLSNGNVSNGAAAGKLNGKLSCSNGKVLGHGAVAKRNPKLTEGNRSANDIYLVGSTDPEDIKNAGNEYYKRGQFSEALVLYDKAIALRPSSAAYRGNKAAALTGLDRLGEAAHECEEAIRLDPSYNRVHQRLASLYLRFGLVESAKRHFRAAGQHADLGDVQRLHEIERHICRCIEARKSSDWSTVIWESDAAVVAGADSAPQVFGYKSEALLKLRKPEEADEVCTAAQRVESSLIKTAVVPVDAFLHMIRAEIDIVLGRFEGAIQAAESAARIDSRNPEVIALLRKARAVCQSRTSGNECFKAGRFFEACALYGEGLESDPDNAVLLCNRAACRSKLGQWEKAVEDCNAALNVQPNYTKALMRRADCSIKLERWEDALRDYEALRREMPSDMEVARALFDVQVAIKKSRGEEIYKMRFGGDVEVVSNNEQFREAVNSPGLAVVQFNTRWSDHCRQISPFVDQLCKRFPCVNFLKVDVDDNPYLAKTESVSFVPTFKIYKNGQKVKDILGPSQQALEYAVKHYSL